MSELRTRVNEARHNHEERSRRGDPVVWLDLIFEILEVLIVSTEENQASIDALTGALGGVQTQLDADVKTLQAELDALANAHANGEPLNFGPAQALAASLASSANAIGGLVPTPPAAPAPVDPPPVDAPPADQPPADAPPA